MSAAELPAPAGAVLDVQPGSEFSINGVRDLLVRRDGTSVRTGREPTAVALLDRGAKVAVLCGRERVLEVYDARTLKRLGRTGAGIGPVGLATDGAQLLYVTDVDGDALLVFHLRPRFELIRRVHVIGGPYGIAFDAARWGLWIALNRDAKVVRYAAGNRPVWRETLPSLKAPQAVSVDRNLLTVSSGGRSQVFTLRRGAGSIRDWSLEASERYERGHAAASSAAEIAANSAAKREAGASAATAGASANVSTSSSGGRTRGRRPSSVICARWTAPVRALLIGTPAKTAGSGVCRPMPQ